ncbi:hypothetical protein CCR97_29600 [Rhodoplanes elegans]|uniref:Uncharacterized protein n=1 Tax=Rhodoplanes elegans TaxID=29408 RepID=A0A327JUV7_9BRAD|nr:hypothetical protein [Rhodoplanes elegans]RAI29273.1 hypothetical protein CH338_28650 [Rhodoplanes elegans]
MRSDAIVRPVTVILGKVAKARLARPATRRNRPTDGSMRSTRACGPRRAPRVCPAVWVIMLVPIAEMRRMLVPGDWWF